MKMQLLIVTMLLLALASSGLAFDGDRKGFVLGGGLGFAPVSKCEGSVIDLSTLSIVKADEEGAGIGGNFIIGFAWDKRL